MDFDLKTVLRAVKGEDLVTLELLCQYLSYIFIGSGICTFIALISGVSAPYGRYTDRAWGFQINAKVAWIVMESPSFFVSLWCFFQSGSAPLVNTLLVSLFMFHYINRSFIFPLLMREGGKPMPFTITLMAGSFTVLNGFLQGSHLRYFASYPSNYFTDPRFVVGTSLFVFGFVINNHADHVLRNLRRPGETGYKIPRGGMFEYISGANYFGEIVEWSGFAIACWSLPALAFAVFTFCNIGPRGYNHHQWYLKKFEDYPSNRKAVIPLIW